MEKEVGDFNQEIFTQGKKTYEINKHLIDLTWVECRPISQEKIEAGKAKIFIPGWGTSETDKSLKTFLHSLAEGSNQQAFAFITRPKEIIKNSLFHEAQAVQKFIEEEKKLNNLTIFGHSQGAIKAIDLVSLLQKKPEVKIDGLILLDPIGLYKRCGLILAKRFIRHAPLADKEIEKQEGTKDWELIKEKMEENQEDFSPGIWDEMKKSKDPINYIRRLLNEIREMSVKNQENQEITIPVLMIQGRRDIISEPEKTDIEKLFKKSPYFKRLLPERWAIHGLALFRQKQIIKIAFYFIKRSQRELAKIALKKS